MKRLTKKQLGDLRRHIARCELHYSALTLAITRFNGEVAEAFSPVQEAYATFCAKLDEKWSELEETREPYDRIVSEAEAFRGSVVEQIRKAIEMRSEQWQQSEEGEAAHEWLADWENEELYECDLDMSEAADPEEPELVALDEENPAAILRRLPTEPAC